MRRSLTRRERLGRGSALSDLFSSGRRVGGRGVKLVVRENDLGWSRVAVVTARGFPSAVRRNRDRRQARELYRNVKSSLRASYDIAIVLYPGPYTAPERRSQIGELLRRSGTLRELRGIDG